MISRRGRIIEVIIAELRKLSTSNQLTDIINEFKELLAQASSLSTQTRLVTSSQETSTSILVNTMRAFSFDERKAEDQISLLRQKLLAILDKENNNNKDFFDSIHAVLILLSSGWPLNNYIKIQDKEMPECPVCLAALSSENCVETSSGYLFGVNVIGQIINQKPINPVSRVPFNQRDINYMADRIDEWNSTHDEKVSPLNLQSFTRAQEYQQKGIIIGATVGVGISVSVFILMIILGIALSLFMFFAYINLSFAIGIVNYFASTSFLSAISSIAMTITILFALSAIEKVINKINGSNIRVIQDSFLAILVAVGVIPWLISTCIGYSIGWIAGKCSHPLVQRTNKKIKVLFKKVLSQERLLHESYYHEISPNQLSRQACEEENLGITRTNSLFYNVSSGSAPVSSLHHESVKDATVNNLSGGLRKNSMLLSPTNNTQPTTNLADLTIISKK